MYVSENDGPYSLWKFTDSTYSNYEGIAGNQYEFYSVSTDLAGNIEEEPVDPKFNPDAVTTICATINNPEICNGVDDNCNGQIDEDCILTLNLHAFIEGFYTGNNTLQPTLFNSGVNANTLLNDSIIVELHAQLDPETVLARDLVVIDVNGFAVAQFPPELIGTSAYIVVKHRNALETWSKLPVTIGANTIYDFTR